MKWVLYLIALSGALLFRPERTDVGKLQPVELVMLYTVSNEVILETDTGDLGKGIDTKAALADLEKTTPGIMYLDTAEYLLVGEGDSNLIDGIESRLKPSVRVCIMTQRPDPILAAEYLDIHKPVATLGRWRSDGISEVMICREKRVELKKR